jgi:ATP-dependent Lhr-like helicase
MSAAFDRLSPALQYQIFNTLRFSELTPVQEVAIGPILDGKNVVLLAPTAGGKTEAAFFPLLSQMDAEDWRPVSVVYVAPIRALLNNQEARIERYADLVGRRAFKWHGDVSPGRKASFLNDPADILLTTPESLEVMLMSSRVPTERVFAGLRAVVIDEVHAFAADDRGGHLSAVLERLSRFCGKDVQRIGLSATVGNPETILSWAAGSSRRPGEVLDVAGSGPPASLALDYVGNEENAARVVAQLHPGRKRLVFVDSRRGVEAMGRNLRALGVEAFVTHSSLSLDERRAAEAAFEHGKDCVIVATSALELGIDIGDLDHVLQVNAPTTVASFLQRMGRTGRRPGTQRNCTFLAVDDTSLWRAAAIIRLHRRGFVEPISLRQKGAHLLAHQILALAIQEDGVALSDWWAWVAHATPFQKLDDVARQALIAHMMQEEILHQDGGRLSLGQRGERLYGFRNFTELYSVFSTPQVMTVLWGAQEVGSVDTYFVEQEEIGELTFTLAARAWRAKDVEWNRGLLHVEPVQDARLARWQGSPHLLGREVCEAMRELLSPGTEDNSWSQRARERMRKLRAEHEDVAAGRLPIQAEPGAYKMWTFGGGRANNLLAKVLESKLGEKVTANNLSLRFKGNAARSEAAIRKAIDELRTAGRPDQEDAQRFAAGCARGRLSKFEPCLPQSLLAAYMAEVLTDAPAAREVLRAENDG